jgi:hypothetical protein
MNIIQQRMDIVLFSEICKPADAVFIHRLLKVDGGALPQTFDRSKFFMVQ